MEKKIKIGDYILAEHQKDEYLIKGVVMGIEELAHGTTYYIKTPGGQERTLNTLNFIVQLLPLIAQIIDFIADYAEQWFGSPAERRARRAFRKAAREAKKGGQS